MKLYEVEADAWLSTDQVAEIFGVSNYVIRKEIKDGGLHAAKFGRSYLVPGWAVIEKATGTAPELAERLAGANDDEVQS